MREEELVHSSKIDLLLGPEIEGESAFGDDVCESASESRVGQWLEHERVVTASKYVPSIETSDGGGRVGAW